MIVKRIVIPEDVALKIGDKSVVNEKGEPQISVFSAFCMQMSNDDKLGKSLAGIKAAVSFAHKPMGKKPGESFDVDPEEWRIFTEVLKDPTSAYTPWVCKQILSFFDAILDAKDIEV